MFLLISSSPPHATLHYAAGSVEMLHNRQTSRSSTTLEWYLPIYCMRVILPRNTDMNHPPFFSIIPKAYITLHNHLLLLLFSCSAHHCSVEPFPPLVRICSLVLSSSESLELCHISLSAYEDKHAMSGVFKGIPVVKVVEAAVKAD